jgi:hypothetical protein
VRASWRAAVATIPESIPAADALVSVLEYAGKAQRDANAKAKSAREAAKLVSGGRAVPPTEAQVRDAGARWATARGIEQAASHAAGADTRRQIAEQKVANVKKILDAETEKLATFTTELESIPAASNTDLIKAMVTVMTASRAENACLSCDGPAPSEAIVEEVKAAADKMEENNKARTVKEAQIKIAKFNVETLTTQHARAVSDLAEQGQPYVGPSVEDAKAALAAAEAEVVKLKSARDTWDTVQKAESTAISAERSADEWGALKDAATEAVGLTLESARVAFVNAVQQHLPASDVFDLRLRDGDREVVQFGLVRGDALHTALSGAEWARVMAAMANATVPAETYACLLPEERAFDPETLESVLVALGDSPHQVIITSPVAPVSVPDGWVVIER